MHDMTESLFILSQTHFMNIIFCCQEKKNETWHVVSVISLVAWTRKGIHNKIINCMRMEQEI